MSYICSNKFLKANYGEKLRKLLLNYKLMRVNDYSGQNVFKWATVDDCVSLINKSYVKDNNVEFNNKFFVNQDRLDEKSWSFEPPEILDLKDKINSKGIKLGSIKGLKINNGIQTGFNKAFIIDDETKNKLASSDSKNKDIIKPVLTGKNIKKWGIKYDNKFLILSKIGNYIKKYSAIKSFFLKIIKIIWQKELLKEIIDVNFVAVLIIMILRNLK